MRGIVARGAWLLVALAACSDEPPAEVAAAHDVLVTDEFRIRGGVILTDQHVLAPLELARNTSRVRVRVEAGRSADAAVLSRDEATGVAVLFVGDHRLDPARVGDSGALVQGTELLAQIFDTSGKPKVVATRFTGWRYHGGRAYLEVDLPYSPEAKGAGLFDPKGKLVGVVQLSLGPGLTFALPLEYVVSEPGGIASNLATRHEPSERFNEQRAAGATHPEPLEMPPDLETVRSEYSYSRSGLVGRVLLLDTPQGTAHTGPVTYELIATGANRQRRSIAQGSLRPPNLQWRSTPEATAAMAAQLTQSFGARYVATHFAPHRYGELRYRVPLAAFCGQVAPKEAHNLVLTLADGRTTGELGYSDLVNVCAGAEGGAGDGWEKAWGFPVLDPFVVQAPATKAKARSKRKGRKGKNKNKIKRKRR